MKTTLLSAILLIQYSLLGQGWTSQTSGTTQSLFGVHFTDASTGWAVGYDGTILHTTNAGATWFFQTSGTINVLLDAHFTDVNTGWAVGAVGTIRHTTNGGTTWSSQSSGTTNSIEDVYFTDANTGWAVGGGGTILHTTNAGATWLFQTSGTAFYLTGVHFTDANTGWIVGAAGTIRKTTNGGTTWIGQSSGTTNFLWGVHFADASSGWAVGYDGTILHTTNGGTTWIGQSSGTINLLLDVHFTNAQTGWVVGGSGTILHTTNAGTTWFLQTSGTTFYLTGVYFTDARMGWAVGLTGTILYYSSGGIPCDEIDLFKAKCDVGGAARAMVQLLHSTEYAGETVEFQLDDTVYPVKLITNGTHTIGRLQVLQAGLGQHTITLLDPSGCYDPVIFNCQVDGAVADPEFDVTWAVFDALHAESALRQLIPQETKLFDNYPNPFNPATTIEFVIRQSSFVQLAVHDILGREVATLVDERLVPGTYTRQWNASLFSSGVYFYQLRVGDFVETKKLVLIR